MGFGMAMTRWVDVDSVADIVEFDSSRALSWAPFGAGYRSLHMEGCWAAEFAEFSGAVIAEAVMLSKSGSPQMMIDCC